MAWIRGEFGLQHGYKENVVHIEFNLQELEWLEAIIPERDAFRQDVLKAIEVLEKANQPVEGPGIAIVLRQRDITDRALGMIAR